MVLWLKHLLLFFFRGPSGFCSQHPRDSSQPLLTPVSEDLVWTRHACSAYNYMYGAKHSNTQIKQINLQEKEKGEEKEEEGGEEK